MFLSFKKYFKMKEIFDLCLTSIRERCKIIVCTKKTKIQV